METRGRRLVHAPVPRFPAAPGVSPVPFKSVWQRGTIPMPGGAAVNAYATFQQQRFSPIGAATRALRQVGAIGSVPMLVEQRLAIEGMRQSSGSLRSTPLSRMQGV